MRVAVIGGGWYGCHIAKTLLPDFDVTLFEANDLFSAASLSNQNRLHLGFHYPRSGQTREDVQRNFLRFRAAYGSCSRPLSPNIYAVASCGSLVDFPAYLQLVGGTVVDPALYGLQNVAGAVLTNEEVIDPLEARKLFLKALEGRIRYTAGPSSGYDFYVDCTYGALGLPSGMYYEVCVMLRYMGPSLGVTIMDGPFPSYYPGVLSHARLTPVFRSRDHAEVRRFMGEYRVENRAEFEESILHYWPGFSECSYVGHTLSVKVKEADASGDTRRCWVSCFGRHAQVISGKISNVFDAGDTIRSWLCSHS